MKIINRHEQITPTRSALKIVIVYEFAAIAIRARAMSEALAADWQSECDSWPMDLLTQSEHYQQAVIAASEADMIIIAIRGAGGLPGVVRNWIECWLPIKKHGPTALVLLLDEEGESRCEPPPICTYLRGVSERGSMDFFSSASQWAIREHTDRINFWPENGDAIEAANPEMAFR